MTKITQFDKATLAQFRIALDAAFASVEKETGVKVSISGIKFSPTSFRTELTAVIAETVSDPLLQGVDSKYITDFNKYQDFKGCLLRQITVNDELYAVVGIHGRTKFVLRRADVPNSKLQLYKFNLNDRLYCKVVNKPYNADIDYSRNN